MDAVAHFPQAPIRILLFAVLEFARTTHDAHVLIPFRTSGAAAWLDAHRRH